MINQQTVNVLEQMECSGNAARFPESMGQLDRPLYEAVNDVLVRLGGKWNKKQRAHIFRYEPAAAIRAVCETRVLPDKNPHAYYPTPRRLAEEMFLAAQLDRADKNVRILEPSAGCGGIVSVLRDQGFTNIDLVELDPINAAVLDNAGYRVYRQNFLDFQPAEQYDYVLMNPPFSVEGDKEAYVTHILHAWSLLKDGGTLIAIVPNSITFKDHKRVQELRGLMARYNGSAMPIAAGEFKESGTMVATTIIGMQKVDPSWRYQPHNGWDSWIAWLAVLYLKNDHSMNDRYYKLAQSDKIASKDTILSLYKDLERILHKENIFEYAYSELRECDKEELYQHFIDEWKEEHGAFDRRKK